jgi:hypothetical protein
MSLNHLYSLLGNHNAKKFSIHFAVSPPQSSHKGAHRHANRLTSFVDELLLLCTLLEFVNRTELPCRQLLLRFAITPNTLSYLAVLAWRLHQSAPAKRTRWNPLGTSPPKPLGVKGSRETMAPRLVYYLLSVNLNNLRKPSVLLYTSRKLWEISPRQNSQEHKT